MSKKVRHCSDLFDFGRHVKRSSVRMSGMHLKNVLVYAHAWFIRHIDKLLLFLSTLLVYTYTAPPSVFLGDSGDMTTAAALFGVAHDPGYPLYSFLGFIWIKLFAIGTIAWRMNVFSAIFAAGGVVLVYIIVKYVTKNTLAAFVAAATLAFSSTYWLFGTTAEVFSLHAFLSLLFLYALVRFYVKHEKKYIYLAAFAFSLSIAHHHTIILWVPGAVILLFASKFWRYLRVRDIFTALIITASGVLWYFYLPISQWLSGLYYWNDGMSIRGVMDIFFRKSYGTFDIQIGGAAVEAGGRAQYLPVYGLLFLYNFSIFGGILAVIGAIWGFVQRRVITVALLLNFVVSGLLFLAYAGLQLSGLFRLGMIEKFSVMSFCIIALFIGFGVDWVTSSGLLQRFFERLQIQRAGVILRGMVVLLPVYLLISHWPALNLRNYWGGWAIGMDMFINAPPHSIIGVTSDTMSFNSRYLTDVENFRNDVIVATSPHPPILKRLEEFAQANSFVSRKAKDDPLFIQDLVENNFDNIPFFVRTRPVSTPEGTFFHPAGMTMQLFKNDEFDPTAQIRRLRYFINNSFFLNHVYGKDTTLPAYARSIHYDYAVTLSNIGWFFVGYNNAEEAIPVFELGKELDPRLVSHYVGLSFVYRQQGACNSALEVLDSYPLQEGTYHYDILREQRTVYELCMKDTENAERIKMLMQEQFGE